MPTLTLRLLGRPQIDVDDQPVALKSQKAQAMLFHLALSRQRHTRPGLAGLLWSDLAEKAARRNLRVELLKLRNELDAFLEVSREQIAFAQTSDHLLDVLRFEECLQGEPTFAELEEAVALYRGGFLEEFQVRDAPLFEEWVTNERERLWQMARQAMLRLVEHYIQRQAYDQGIECVHKLLQEEPWLEEAHQQLMRLLAFNGQRSAALAHYETASRILDDEFGVPPSDETNALYDQIETGELGPESNPLVPQAPTTPADAPTPLPPPFQAPAALLHFVGREDELAALMDQLLQPEPNPTVALIGMAGVGKTTLATQVAHGLRDCFPDGVLWAYTAATEPLDILGSWAQALGYDFSSLSDVENRAAALRGVVAEKQLLLILDDVRSVARVRPLLVGGPASATLLTTRDLEVAIALNAQPYSLVEMTQEDGEQLLVRVLGEERVRAEEEAAQQICALLQNLPLAVEIAAQRLRSRPRRRLADLAARLQSIQGRLELAISDRAVRTSFVVSWESLDRDQRRVFALLGVFGGRSFAAPALAQIADLDLYTAEDRLFTLTALSLLNEEESEGDAAERYRQHPLLADFAQEQLGEDRDACLRMIHYYLTFAQEHQTDYAALQPEWENLVAGMRTAHNLAEWQLVLDYADTLTEPWFTRARYTEARQAYPLAQTAAEALGDEQALAESLLRWGHACVEQYDYDEAESLLKWALEMCNKCSYIYGIADSQYHLARIALDHAVFDEAQALLNESQQLFQSLKNVTGIANTFSQQALLAYRRGNLQNSKHLCNQVLALEENSELFTARLLALRLLADIALEEQIYEIAEQYCNQSLIICEQLHNRSELAAIYYSLTVVARCKEEAEVAKRFAQKAIEYCDITGNRGVKALTLHELSRIYILAGYYEQAILSSEEGMNLLLAIPDNFNLVYILRQLGEAYTVAGKEESAVNAWSAALELAETQQHPLIEQLRMKI